MKFTLSGKKVLLVASFIWISQIASAVGGPAGGPPPGGSPTTGSPPPCWTPPCVPIDGGIGILLAAGAFVGGRKIYRGTKE